MTDVLDKERHQRLLMDADSVCETANIPRTMLERSARDFCGAVELDWLINYPARVHDGRNLLLTGEQSPGPEVKMMAIAAALLRNFIDARVVPLNTLLQILESNDPFEPTVLLVPNLYVRGGGRTLPAWKMQRAYDLLLQRRVSGRLSVVYVESMAALKSEFGLVFAQHLEDHYDVASGE